MKSTPRQDLIARTRDHLMRTSAPRLHLLLIIMLAGLAAFFGSVAGLRFGLGSMALRYPLAVACGYLTFFVVIRLWIAWQRRYDDSSRGLDVVGDLVSSTDLTNVDLRPHTPAGFDVDWGDLWPLAVAALCVVGGVIAILYVIYAAPILLAEVTLDAVIISVVYRRLRREDVSHWAVTVLRRTWVPALVVLLFAAVGGYVLQQAAPGARSIGDVMQEISSLR